MSIMNGKVSVNDLRKSLQHFDWPDYVVFLMMLGGSAVIGIYFGFVEKKSKTKSFSSEHHESEAAQEYLMGGRKMSVIPVAVSLVASWISGISLLGLATEIYLYGTSYIFIIISLFISSAVIHYIFLPVFYNLQLTSVYEYLEIRFDKRVRLLGSILYAIATLAYLPVVIYVPALAFNQATGVNIHIVTPFVCAVCIFYTSVGGLKAVVWTDCLQTVAMLLSMVVIIIKGTSDISGFQAVWTRNHEGDRLNYPELTLDLTERHSVLSLLIGGVTFHIYTCGMGQEMIQRYVSLPTQKDANKALLVFTILMGLFVIICCYNGLLAYAYYAGCDPLTTKLINAADQLLPLLLMNVLGSYRGMPGLFIAGIFSAALSTLSTCLNSMAAIVLEDFVKPFARTPLSEKLTNYLMRGTVLVIGVISVCLVFVVERMGTVLQLSITLSGMTGGPIFGMFTIGFMCPWVKQRGAFVGGIVSLAAMVWMLISAQHAMASGELTFAVRPLTTDNCSYTFPSHLSTTKQESYAASNAEEESAIPIHHMSYLFYPIFGAAISIIVSSLISLAFKEQSKNKLSPTLFSPFVRKYLYSTVSPTDEFETKDTQL
ncbi:Sodium-coupled monocarboxylate transporter 1 [Pseudolycoriella hygida]|uniref:Sodium-coupled monocarboxylate transporter 1 n=1 Tax=Pseudolycoriella hygida TaxID=35572 RepID=A0A9Q0S0C4_9DIPT|nr:Sodium-coupled monocarboxylate transporter 1 [Pseudolycoriella hygida]